MKKNICNKSNINKQQLKITQFLADTNKPILKTAETPQTLKASTKADLNNNSDMNEGHTMKRLANSISSFQLNDIEIQEEKKKRIDESSIFKIDEANISSQLFVSHSNYTADVDLVYAFYEKILFSFLYIRRGAPKALFRDEVFEQCEVKILKYCNEMKYKSFLAMLEMSKVYITRGKVIEIITRLIIISKIVT